MDEHCAQCAQEIDGGGFDLLFANSCQFYRTTSLGRFANSPFFICRNLFAGSMRRSPKTGGRRGAEIGDHGWQAVKRAFADWREVRNARVQVREEIANAKAFDRILCNSCFSRESILRAYGSMRASAILASTQNFSSREVHPGDMS